MTQVLHRKPIQPDAELISGVLVAKESARAIKEKVNFIASESRKQRLLYFTGSTMFIPRLSKSYVISDVSEPFMELLTEKQSDDLAADIMRSQANEILFDAEDSYLSGDKFRTQCWKYLEGKIAPDFAYDRTADGWAIFKRTKTSSEELEPSIFLKVLEP
jgi:hypothetical protein